MDLIASGRMVVPPRNLVIEIPSSGGGPCANACRHCIHRGLKADGRVPLSRLEILDSIRQGAGMGIPMLILYPHQSDVTLENPEEFAEYAEVARSHGMSVKSVTAGTRPETLGKILPRLDRLAVSVDSLDPEMYGAFRSTAGFSTLMETIDLLRDYRRNGGRIYLSGLVMVDRTSIERIEERLTKIQELDLFDKIKILELLPIGSAEGLRGEALAEGEQINRLTRLRKAFAGSRTTVGVPLWRIRRNGRGCRLGEKDLVIGPGGELAGCTLMLYQNAIVGNIRSVSLTDAWEERFQIFRRKPVTGLSDLCYECAFYRHDRCWGGCPARAWIFGAESEIRRSCQIASPQESERVFQEMCVALDHNEVVGCGINEVLFRVPATAPDVSTKVHSPRESV